MRVLVAIESCHAHRSRHRAQEETWLRDLSVEDYRFFLGRNPSPSFRETNEVFLDVDDSYEALSLKTQAICRWASERDFDYLFKCDTDTVINPVNLMASPFANSEYLGGHNEDIVPVFSPNMIQFASGGAGYFLSK